MGTLHLAIHHLQVPLKPSPPNFYHRKRKPVPSQNHSLGNLDMSLSSSELAQPLPSHYSLM